MTREEFIKIKFQTDTEEAETLVNMYPQNDFFVLYTCDQIFFNKNKKRLWEFIEAGLGEIIHRDIYGIQIKLPSEYLTFNKPKNPESKRGRAAQQAAKEKRKKGE